MQSTPILSYLLTILMPPFLFKLRLFDLVHGHDPYFQSSSLLTSLIAGAAELIDNMNRTTLLSVDYSNVRSSRTRQQRPM